MRQPYQSFAGVDTPEAKISGQSPTAMGNQQRQAARETLGLVSPEERLHQERVNKAIGLLSARTETGLPKNLALGREPSTIIDTPQNSQPSETMPNEAA